jgi:hypothetical protein
MRDELGAARCGRRVACGGQGRVVPGHDIVGDGRGRNTSRRVCLHALFVALLASSCSAAHQLCYLFHVAARVAYLEVAHQTAAGGGRHCAAVGEVIISDCRGLASESKAGESCERRRVQYGAGIEMRE